MLILTRRPSEAIKIGGEVTVMVVAVHGASVKLGIRAPRHVAVDRQEIGERKRQDATKAPAEQNALQAGVIWKSDET